MNSLKEGDVVIVITTQAGTVFDISGKSVMVLLQNGDIWRGLLREVRSPQDQADLQACPVEVDRFEGR